MWAVKCIRQLHLAADPSVTSSLANAVLKPEFQHEWTKRDLKYSSTSLILERKQCFFVSK